MAAHSGKFWLVDGKFQRETNPNKVKKVLAFDLETAIILVPGDTPEEQGVGWAIAGGDLSKDHRLFLVYVGSV